MDYDTNLASGLGGLTGLDGLETDEDSCVYLVDALTDMKLGRQGENLTQTVRIDCASWLAALPGCTLLVAAVRPGEREAYLPRVTVEGGVITWPIAAQDVALDGWGSCEVRAMLDGRIKKSAVCATRVEPGLVGDQPAAPATPPDWVQTILDGANVERNTATYAATAQAAANAAGAIVERVSELVELENRVFDPPEMEMLVLADLAEAGKINNLPGFLFGPLPEGGAKIYFRKNANYSAYWFRAVRDGRIRVNVRTTYGQLVIASGAETFDIAAADFYVPCAQAMRLEKADMAGVLDVHAGDLVGISSNNIDSGVDVWSDLFAASTVLAGGLRATITAELEELLQVRRVSRTVEWRQGGVNFLNGYTNNNANRITSELLGPERLDMVVAAEAALASTLRCYDADFKYLGNMGQTALPLPLAISWAEILGKFPECRYVRVVLQDAANAEADVAPEVGALVTVTQRRSVVLDDLEARLQALEMAGAAALGLEEDEEP